MSTWSAFRQHWLKPDVYPLIAIMTGALSLGSVALIHTAHNPAVHWDSRERRVGVRAWEGEGRTPFVARFRARPATVFERTEGRMWDTLASRGEGGVFVVQSIDEEAEEVGLAVVLGEEDDKGDEAEDGGVDPVLA